MRAYDTGAVIGRYSKSHLALTCSFVHCFLDPSYFRSVFFFSLLKEGNRTFIALELRNINDDALALSFSSFVTTYVEA